MNQVNESAGFAHSSDNSLPIIAMTQQELTRRVMYDLVWSKPMTKVAEEFGISDVALKKICQKHRVPTPPRGYWAKKDAGKPVKQVSFHDTADPQDERIVIYGSRSKLPPEVRQVLDQERERRKASARSRSIAEPVATEPVHDVHAAVAATARALRKAKPDADGVVDATGLGLCGIEVGSASVERVIAVLDGIGRGLEARRLMVEPSGTCMRVAIPPDAISFSLIERVEKRNHVPTLEELAKEERLRKKEERNARLGIWSFGRERAYPEFDFIRTGEFSVQIAEQYVGGLRRSWKDGRRQRVEDLVDDIVSGIVTYLAGVKAKRKEHERWQREWRRREQREVLARAREEREERRRKFLQRFVTISTDADELQSFLDRLRPRVSECRSGELARMMEWAEARLQRLEGELTPEGISSALRERKLFPEVDDLAAPEPDDIPIDRLLMRRTNGIISRRVSRGGKRVCGAQSRLQTCFADSPRQSTFSL